MTRKRRSIYLAMGLAIIAGSSFVLFRIGEELTGSGFSFLREIGPFMLIFAFGFLLVCFGLPKKWLPRIAGIVGEGD